MRNRLPSVRGFVALAAFAALCGCSDSDSGTGPEPPVPGPDGAREFREVVTGWDAGYSRSDDGPLSEPTLFVIRDRMTWERFWSRLHTGYWPEPAMPPVDFREETLLAVVDVTRPWIWNLQITEVEVVDGRLTVMADATEYCGWPAESEPYQVVAIDGTEWVAGDLIATHLDPTGCGDAMSGSPE